MQALSSQPGPFRSRAVWLGAWGLLLALAGAGYALHLTTVATLAWDDGFYLTLGKALATGQGYRVISTPGQPVECALPPGYPALLALLWLLLPDFPANVLAFKALNVVLALLAVAGMGAWVMAGPGASRGKALAAAALLAVSSAMLAFVDATLSEVVYLAASTWALAAIEAWLVKPERPAAGLVVLAAAAVAVPAHLRSLGLGLVVGVVLWLALVRKWRTLAIYLAATAALFAPWQLWTHLTLASGVPVYFSYANWVDKATGNDKLAALVMTLVQNSREVLVSGLPNVLLPIGPALAHGRHLAPLAPLALALVLGLGAWGLVLTAWPRPRVLHGYVLAYLGVVLVFPWSPTRYVAGLAPVLLYALVEAIWWLGARRPRPLALAAALAAYVLCAAWGLSDLGVARHESLDPHHPGRLQDAAIARTVAATPADAVVVCQYEFLVYLLTGRQTLPWHSVSPDFPAKLAQAEAAAGRRPHYLLVPTWEPLPAYAPALTGWEPVPGPADTGFALYRRLSKR